MLQRLQSRGNLLVISVSLLVLTATLATLSPKGTRADGGVPIKAQDDSGALCLLGNATLRGTYMSIGGGTAVGVGPVTFIGEINYDGKGNSTNPFTGSFNGAIFKGNLTANYTVNSDCTGSLTASDGSSHYDFVVSPDGSKVNFIETDKGFVVSGTIVRFKD